MNRPLLVFFLLAWWLVPSPLRGADLAALFAFATPGAATGVSDVPIDDKPKARDGELPANYFVDYESGMDSNSGRSPETPWKHCPGDTAATGVAKTTLLAPGDIVRFKGGVVYAPASEIRLTTSGNSAATIVFDGNLDGKWGTGRAIIDKNYLTGRRCFKATIAVKHITIKGFEFRNVGGYADNDPLLSSTNRLITHSSVKHGIALEFNVAGSSNIRIEHCFFHRIGNWRTQLPFSGGNTIKGSGIQITDVDGFYISKCEFTKVAKPIEVRSKSLCKNVTIEDCHIHNFVVWGIDVTALGHGAALDGIRIRHCRIHDYHEFDLGNWASRGENPHSNGIFFRTNGYRSSWRNNEINGCLFYADDPGKSKGGTSSISLGNGPSVNIVNCVFIKDRHGNSTIGIAKDSASTHKQVVRILNNTFLSGPTHITITGATTNREIHIENNIFYKDHGVRVGQNYHMIHYASGSFPNILNHNLYFDPNWRGRDRGIFKMESRWRPLAYLKSRGWDLNGAYADPEFKSLSGRPSTYDLRLKAGSPAKRMGRNLSEYFSDDADGNARPSSGPWTVGAYQ